MPPLSRARAHARDVCIFVAVVLKPASPPCITGPVPAPVRAQNRPGTPQPAPPFGPPRRAPTCCRVRTRAFRACGILVFLFFLYTENRKTRKTRKTAMPDDAAFRPPGGAHGRPLLGGEGQRRAKHRCLPDAAEVEPGPQCPPAVPGSGPCTPCPVSRPVSQPLLVVLSPLSPP